MSYDLQPRIFAFVLPIIVLLYITTASLNDSESIQLIRLTSQAYLDHFFGKFDSQHLTSLKMPSQALSTPPLPSTELRQRIVACINLSQRRMKDYREIYTEEALKASKRLNVREDDSLRLFFVGDLLTCLENLDSATARAYTQLLRSNRPSLLSISDTNKIFQRTLATPLKFSESQSQMISIIADNYIANGGEIDEGRSLFNFFLSFISIPALSGNVGLCYCATLLAGILGGAFVFDGILSSSQATVGRSTTDSPPDLKTTSNVWSKGKKQKRR